MQQQIAVITLGVSDLARSRRFYVEGFGWQPVFENTEIVFYQMNGLVLGTWLRSALAADMGRADPPQPGGFALAHNVTTAEEVQPTIDRLVRAGGLLLRAADAPPKPPPITTRRGPVWARSTEGAAATKDAPARRAPKWRRVSMVIGLPQRREEK